MTTPTNCFDYTIRMAINAIAVISTIGFVTMIILMDYKGCINTPLNTTYIFENREH